MLVHRAEEAGLVGRSSLRRFAQLPMLSDAVTFARRWHIRQASKMSAPLASAWATWADLAIAQLMSLLSQSCGCGCGFVCWLACANS